MPLKKSNICSVEYQWNKDMVHFNLDKIDLTAEQQLAYWRACMILRKARQPNDVRIFALFSGLVASTADFDEPLPDEITDLFYGSATDEYGISLPQ